MAYSVQHAISYLSAYRAHHVGIGVEYSVQCTCHAIEAGGLSIERHITATQIGRALERAGFYEVSQHDPVRGDVVVVHPIPRHVHGFMAMHVGDEWISSVRSHDVYPDEAFRAYRPSYAVYRHG